jgi:hypothetical protein
MVMGDYLDEDELMEKPKSKQQRKSEPIILYSQEKENKILKRIHQYISHQQQERNSDVLQMIQMQNQE